jgi:15-cis-phytoene synthase
MTTPYRNLADISATEITQAYDHCHRLTRQADTNFALGFRFLPKSKRDAIYAIYAFNRCADDFVDDAKEAADAEALIAEWEAALHACYEERARHPVMIAFADAIKRYQVPKKPFLDALEGFRMDLSVNRYETFDELIVYCERVASTISTMSLSVFGYADAQAEKWGRDLSMALQLTNIIRDVGEDVERNRIYLPLEDLRRFGCSEDDILARNHTDAFQQLMAFQVERTQSYFRNANNLVPLLEKDAQLTTWLMGSVYADILQKIEHSGYRVLEMKAALSRWEKLGVVVRTLFKPKFI